MKKKPKQSHNDNFYSKSKKNVLTFLKIILIATTLIFPASMVIPAGAGLVYNGSSYGVHLIRIGWLLVLSGILMIAGSILVCLKKNIASLIFSCSGFTLCMLMLRLIVNHADAAGWSDKYTMELVSSMYLSRILPVIAPFALSAAIAVIQFFSYEAVQSRREKKRLKDERENRPAPPII